MLRVTRHAIERYQERVADVSDEQAEAALSSPAIQAAASFGCEYVRLATGHRVVVKDNAVVTVQPREHYQRQVGRINVGYVKRFRKRRWDASE